MKPHIKYACMKRYCFVVLIGLSLVATKAAAQSASPLSATEVIHAACATAKTAHKKVFLVFHASWCGWCRRLDSLMGSPSCKDLFDRNYVIAHLVILENGSKKSLDNPGAMDLYTKYAGGDNQGIPFFLIIDGDGTVLADSRIKPEGAAPGSSGANTGYPNAKEEVAYFVRILKETSALSSAQLDIISREFSMPAS